MDEFSLYHRITCDHYPKNSLNTFRISCHEFNLTLPFSDLTLPLREYAYMGSATSLYYYPLFTLWPNPMSARFLGIIFLLIQSILLAKIFEKKTLPIFIGLILFFPYFFQHVIDTGVVGFQITCFIAIFYCLKKWLNTFNVRWSIFLAIIIFLGFWSKLSFTWLFPGIVLTGLMLVWENRARIFQKEGFKKVITQGALAGILCAILSGVLLFSTDQHDNFYYQEMLSGQRGFVDTLKYFHPKIIANSDFIKSFINPFATTQKIYEVFSLPWFSFIYFVSIYLAIPLAWIFIYLKEGKEYIFRQNFYKSALFYGIFIATFVMIYLTPAARLMHHAVITIPFLLISAGYLINHVQKEGGRFPREFYKKIAISWLIFFAFINLTLLFTFTHQPIRLINDPSLKDINRTLNNQGLAKDYFYVAIDWGIYYYQGLYGPKDQSVLYIEPLNTNEQVEMLKELAKKNGRKLLFVMLRDPDFTITTPEEKSDRVLVQKTLGLIECKVIDKNAPWTIWLEPQEKENVCLP